MSNERKRGQKSVFVTVGTTQFEKLINAVCRSDVLTVRTSCITEIYVVIWRNCRQKIYLEFPQLLKVGAILNKRRVVIMHYLIFNCIFVHEHVSKIKQF